MRTPAGHSRLGLLHHNVPGVLAQVLKPGTRFAGDHPVLSFEAQPVASERPLPAFHVGAGCLFAPGRIAEHFPYDPWLYFHGEEQALALRLYTHGWDLFHMPGLPVRHLYNDAASGAPDGSALWIRGWLRIGRDATNPDRIWWLPLADSASARVRLDDAVSPDLVRQARSDSKTSTASVSRPWSWRTRPRSRRVSITRRSPRFARCVPRRRLPSTSALSS